MIKLKMHNIEDVLNNAIPCVVYKNLDPLYVIWIKSGRFLVTWLKESFWYKRLLAGQNNLKIQMAAFSNAVIISYSDDLFFLCMLNL